MSNDPAIIDTNMLNHPAGSQAMSMAAAAMVMSQPGANGVNSNKITIDSTTASRTNQISLTILSNAWNAMLTAVAQPFEITEGDKQFYKQQDAQAVRLKNERQLQELSQQRVTQEDITNLQKRIVEVKKQVVHALKNNQNIAAIDEKSLSDIIAAALFSLQSDIKISFSKDPQLTATIAQESGVQPDDVATALTKELSANFIVEVKNMLGRQVLSNMGMDAIASIIKRAKVSLDHKKQNQCRYQSHYKATQDQLKNMQFTLLSQSQVIAA